MKPASNNVLHIIPHAGGGVGSVIRALLAEEIHEGVPYIHSVASLEYLNDVTRQHCDRYKIKWIDKLGTERRADLPALLSEADIVLVHWWNHPLLMRLLFEGLPPCRLVLWSHVNGFFSPHCFFSELFEIPDRFVFASKSSFDAPVIKMLPSGLKSKFRVIRSCAGIPAGSRDICSKSNAFQAGYVGTVGPLKMHSDFLNICANAALSSPCIVVGGPDHEQLRARAQAMGLTDFFKIIGPVADPRPIFKQLQAFAYPLNPKHYGTGEQVLVEAMAFGAVPVVLANPPESAIIRHGETGLVARSVTDFSAALRMLMENPAERERLAARGHSFVMEECGIEHSIKAFNELFNEILLLPKCPRKLSLPAIDGVLSGSPFHLFLASCGNSDERRYFEHLRPSDHPCKYSDAFASKTQGTPIHYLNMLGNDPRLEAVINAIQVRSV